MKIFESKNFNFPYLVTFVLLVVVFSGFETAFAQVSNQFTVITGSKLHDDPLAVSILEKIEIMKQRFRTIQDQQNLLDNHQKFIDEQRKIANQKLQEELERMNKKYETKTPSAAFASFVSKKPAKLQDLYWDMFNYHRIKVKAAQEAMKKIMDEGGDYFEARKAYNKIAAIKRVDLIELNKNLNIKYGFADKMTQLSFDKYGKLPRYD